MEYLNASWENIKIYRFTDFHYTPEKGKMPYSVELKNKEVISIECWISRIQHHIEKYNHHYLYDALEEFWTKNPNGNPPKFEAYCSYALQSFNMPTWMGYKEFKSRGLYIEELGDVYPWPKKYWPTK